MTMNRRSYKNKDEMKRYVTSHWVLMVINVPMSLLVALAKYIVDGDFRVPRYGIAVRSTVPFSEGGRFDSSWLPLFFFVFYSLVVAQCLVTALTFSSHTC
jgi:hypothetical protein